MTRVVAAVLGSVSTQNQGTSLETQREKGLERTATMDVSTISTSRGSSNRDRTRTNG